MKLPAFLNAVLLSPMVWAAGTFDAPPPTQKQIEADWLRQEVVRQQPGSSAVRPEQDAAGAVDGFKNGQWGFHTGHEANPWWQVDLQQPTRLGRVVLWNRCDGMAGRNARIRILVSLDGTQFQQVYEHNGAIFYGYTDQRPLTVPLPGTLARFVRLTLPQTDYLHLDEVEIFGAAGGTNLALGRPATQSSVSQWSTPHTPPTPNPAAYDVGVVAARGYQLAASLRRLGVKVEAEVQVLRAAEAAGRQLTKDPEQRRLLYLQARRAVRRMALRNPLLGFDSLLFVKKAPPAFPHMSDQHYGWWQRGGGGIYAWQKFKDEDGQISCLTRSFPVGTFTGPDVSWDGQKVLFAYSRFYPGLHAQANKVDKAQLPEEAFQHIFEMNADGSGLRQLTHGKYDDFDPRYLPNGEIVFLSTRKGQALQCSRRFTETTCQADLPDSYVRCGGDNWRPVPVFTLHGMDAQGRNLRPLSAFENFEWAPSVANDGRLLFTRWDYIDRFNGHFFSLWSANQDGTNPQLVYGNYTVKPQVVVEARSIPRSSKLVFTAAAHHSNTGGSLCLLDRTRGTEEERPLTRLTPEVCFPETEGSPRQYFANPWPLSEEFFLVGWADAPLPPHRFVTDAHNPTNAMGIYLLDAFGNLELLYRDPAISSGWPMPLARRDPPPALAPQADWNVAPAATFLVQDIYRGLESVPRGSVRQLRIVAVPPKVQPHMNQPSLGVSAEDPGKFVLGQVPVEPDGSAYFHVPSGVPVFFQALDGQGLAVQTMRSLTYVLPGQTLACVGCHEPRDLAPPTGASPLAARRPPSKLIPGPEGSWPLQFDRLVQPVLDEHCVRCHRPGGEQLAAARLDLSAANALQGLLSFADKDLAKLVFERDRSVPGQGPAANSQLWQLLTQPGGHREVVLDRASRDRLALWMDTYAQRQGHFSPEQETQLRHFREQQAFLMQPSSTSR